MRLWWIPTSREAQPFPFRFLVLDYLCFIIIAHCNLTSSPLYLKFLSALSRDKFMRDSTITYELPIA